ncbi:hypothetical protein DWB61_12705 [Ancylomarina euxinus]|uniref:DUF3575 domain-containing protein n=1 Tax=Ancylomarina euxinus TaxID=2283627 RepID=A0A425XYZ4_9BACT|nr:hypothetical protein [Ancylomarina euxinus]MCZ4695578.1 hypothetical protein [Ancylomarina euxinus]MUP15959.1 hypothetical protein [Ancylomarina euxinus]RRG20400.1 hypothetical protein DWB61_12705 [Ancylomarina euxinus]
MKEIRIVSLVGLCLFLSVMAYSQENDDDLRRIMERKNNIDLSIGGTGLFASVNYNRMIFVKTNYFVNASVGIGTVPLNGGIAIPHQVTFNLGKKSSFLELGIGGTCWSGKSNASGYTETLNSYQLSPIIGWRKHFGNNLIFRVYANPLFRISGEYYIEDYSVIPYLGISLGYSF